MKIWKASWFRRLPHVPLSFECTGRPPKKKSEGMLRNDNLAIHRNGSFVVFSFRVSAMENCHVARLFRRRCGMGKKGGGGQRGGKGAGSLHWGATRIDDNPDCLIPTAPTPTRTEDDLLTHHVRLSSVQRTGACTMQSSMRMPDCFCPRLRERVQGLY